MKVKRWGVFMLAAMLFMGIAGKAVEVKAEDETDTSYLNARVSSKGSAEGDAVIKGDCASVVWDEERGSNVLKLNGGTDGGGYLLLPEELYEGVTDGFSIAMDLYVMENAVAYQRIFQSTTVKLGAGRTGSWDSPDVSVDLSDFSNFRVNFSVGTGDTARTKSSAYWGSGVVTGEWKRLVMSVQQKKVIMYYDGEMIETKLNRNIVKRLFEEGVLEAYRYNALGRSVYNTDTDICAMYDNVAFYTYALDEQDALAPSLPADAKYVWDFEDDSVRFSENAEIKDSVSCYTDGTELSKVMEVKGLFF